MIQILTPEEVKTGPSRAMEEQRARVRDLSIEEERLVNSINTLHDTEREEEKRTDDAIQKMRNSVAAERVELELQIAPLKTERAELMKPIGAIRKEADDRNAKSKVREVQIIQRETAVADREEDVAEREADFIAEMQDGRQVISEREEVVARREKAAQAEADRLALSAQDLSQKWVEYHEAVNKKNAEIEEKEASVAAAKRVNEIARLENEKRTIEHREKDREIADRYATLERAITRHNKVS